MQGVYCVLHLEFKMFEELESLMAIERSQKLKIAIQCQKYTICNY